ncbi:MAG: hypothetical protein JJU02_04000 [Cryomorphaceae bacterium]|nr:hypothetical protein [Cryomorphaceae bacterium]
MKLESVLNELNSFEKNSFLKIIDSIISNSPQNQNEVDKIISGKNELKNVENANIQKVFGLIESEFVDHVRNEFVNTSSQLDILIDIIAKEGNAIIKADWFSRLYEDKIIQLKDKISIFKKRMEGEINSDEDIDRIRDYRIYKNCLHTAFYNDEVNNQDKKITSDELSILLTLAKQLELSQEEIKLINYQVIPVEIANIDDVINELKSIGVIFYSKKQNTIYVADEMVAVLRKVRGKEVADKYLRRVLKHLKEPQINLICKKHGIETKNSFDEKVNKIIEEGISFSGILMDEIHKKGTNLTQKKKFLNEFFDLKLKINPPIKGVKLEDKINNLIEYYNNKENDDKVGISIEGFDQLLKSLDEYFPDFKENVRNEYQFKEENVLKSDFLLNFNLKPRDILELIPSDKLTEFCKERGFKYRGDVFQNILDEFKDSDKLYIENFPLVGYRDLKGLKDNGVSVKEVDLGKKFEDLTKEIFSILGFNVDENLKKEINTKKDKADIVISVGDNQIIIIECKTVKESGFNKFSSVSRQLKSYARRAEDKGFKVIKSLLIAPEFSDDFIKECGLEYELNLSLISAETLLKIYNGFKESKLKSFPYNLFMRDVLIQEERVLKAIGR